MKTTLDQDQILYELINDSLLKIAISGRVYRGGDVADPKKENVVIKSIVIDGGQIQGGVCNVNIHVPDINPTIDGKSTKMPNITRLIALKDLAIDILKHHEGEDYNLYIESQNMVQEPEMSSHFINIRIRFNFFNLS